ISDPPSIVAPEFRLVDGASMSLGRVAGESCLLDQACIVPLIGGCSDVAGTVVDVGFCGCQVTDVPRACITCGSGAHGACGQGCEFPVGTAGLEARGQCLPSAPSASDCVCFAVPAGGEITVGGCGTTIDGVCPGGGCCADDPRDGCETTSDGIRCAGVCV